MSELLQTELFQKLEEKVMVLLTEVEKLRYEAEEARATTRRLIEENSALKIDKENYKSESSRQAEKIQELIKLTIDVLENSTSAPIPMISPKPVLVQQA